MVTFMAIAQTPATFKFLGIPVDGKKSDVIAALKDKGFVYDAKNDVLKGKFNGMDSMIMVSENYGKVDRIYVADANTCNEAQIRIRYNNLLYQFQNNKKYLDYGKNEPIPDDEKISYEMMVHNKSYEAAFFFNPLYEMSEEESDNLADKFAEKVAAEVEAGTLSGEKIKEQIEALTAQNLMKMIEETMEGQVWFTISEYYGKYYISLYYDNMKNRPNGEDL